MADLTHDSGLLRSEPMSLVQLYVPSEAAHATVEELGELKRVIEFRDLNPDVNPFQRTFVAAIRRISELARQLRYLKSKIDNFEIPLRSVEDARHILQGRSGPQIIDELEVTLKELEARVATMEDTYEDFRKKQLELEELRCVLRETAVFFQQAEGRHEEIRTSFDGPTAPLLENAAERGEVNAGESGFDGYEPEFIAGTVPQARMGTFERVLWRVLRGNLYMNFAPIEEPFEQASGKAAEENKVHKNVFIIFAHGRELLDKIRKISESLGAKVFDIPSSVDSRSEALREVTARLEDLSSLTYNTERTLKGELSKVAENYTAWSEVVGREKRVYETLNGWQLDRSTFIAEGWVPKRDIPRVALALDTAKQNAGLSVGGVLSEIHSNSTPPTFHRTNKFTEGFQSIIDAYGVASYQEVNPGLFTIITFPFLFAVMFGDIGHGLIMASSAAALIYLERKYPKGFGSEIFDTFFFGRYIIFLMGVFAIFTGLIYNDIFSLSLRIGPSGWNWPKYDGPIATAVSNGGVYPFGIDPAWHGVDNALLFTNSLKMKMSVILGVIHMSFAICLQIPNFLHFNKRSDIWTIFVPQIIFMESIFGYLILTIIYKWLVDWSKSDKSPPNLLNMLIYMFLSPGTVSPDQQLYPGQGPIQVILLLLAFVCVPWMLCVKPYLEWKEHQHKVKQGYQTVGNGSNGVVDSPEDEDDEENGGHHTGAGGEHEEEFVIGDVIIHQVIHTIEYCLGCISNTASYLRLWALSLAHAQLSEVLWSMTISKAFQFEGALGVVFTVIMFAAWFSLTIAILVVMEGLSAFLHALRLHWVESNGKHYEGAGTPFQPLNFEDCSADIDG